MHVQCTQRPEEGTRSPEAGVTGGYLNLCTWTLKVKPTPSERAASTVTC